MENKFAPYINNNLNKEPVKEVTEDDVLKELNNMKEQSSHFVTKEGKAEKGDITNIDFEGFVDGVAFEGGKGSKYDLTLGSGTFIPGFEDQLIGSQKGDKIDVNVTFPENYQAENLKGKKAVFKCTVNEVKKKVQPDLNDDLAKSYGLETFDALQVAVKNKLTYQAQEKAINAYIEKLLDKLIKESALEVAETALASRKDEMLSYYNQSMSQYGMTLDSYLQASGTSKETFDAKLTADATTSVKADMIYAHVAEAENLTCSDEELDNEVNALKAYYQMTTEQMENFKNEKRKDIEAEVVRQKVSAFLYKNNN